jgi:hypothetical protein
VAPSKGLSVSTLEFTSQPDGNTLKMLFTRPGGDEVVPCISLHPRRRDDDPLALRREFQGLRHRLPSGGLRLTMPPDNGRNPCISVQPPSRGSVHETCNLSFRADPWTTQH